MQFSMSMKKPRLVRIAGLGRQDPMIFGLCPVNPVSSSSSRTAVLIGSSLGLRMPPGTSQERRSAPKRYW